MSPTRHAFDVDFTIYHVAELKPQLLDLVAAAEALELDLSRVERIDSAGLQLLVLAKREAAAAGKPLAIVAHGPAVQALIEFYQLAAWFGDPIVVARAAT